MDIDQRQEHDKRTYGVRDAPDDRHTGRVSEGQEGWSIDREYRFKGLWVSPPVTSLCSEQGPRQLCLYPRPGAHFDTYVVTRRQYKSGSWVMGRTGGTDSSAEENSPVSSNRVYSPRVRTGNRTP